MLRQVNINKNINIATEFNEWSSDQKKFFNRYCSDEMKQYGYEI